MQVQKSNSKFVLKLIGMLFTVISFALLFFIYWLAPVLNDSPDAMEAKGFFTAALILGVTTLTISAFIWWIVFNPKWFVSQE